MEQRRKPFDVETSPRQIPCPKCGADVQVQLGIAPSVVWQAVRLQAARPGAIAYCPQCNSYFVFGPCALTEEAGPPAAEGDRANAGDKDDEPTAPPGTRV